MCKMRHLLMILLISLITIANAFAVEYDVDYASFRASEEFDIVEIYLMLPRDGFKFVPVGDKFQSNILIRVALAQNDTVIAMDEWTIVDQKDDTLHNISSQKIPEFTSLQAKPGSYQLITLVADLNTGLKYKQEKKIELRDYAGNNLKLSDIHICGLISKTEKKNKFSRYFGYDMIPNASLIFGVKNRMLYAFCEVYHLGYSETASGSYRVRYSIMDLNGKELNALDWKTKLKPGDSAVEIEGINITSLSSGIYDLKIEVIDDQTGDKALASRRFYVLKDEKPEIFRQLIEEEELKNLTKTDIDKIFGPMKYIATGEEIKKYKKSDLHGKRQVIAHFWDNRDKNPQTEINETKLEFEDRLKYANEQFGTSQMPGWKTDMGRVFIIYGSPSEVERFPSSLEKKPYQVWNYNEIEGGVLFVFVDKSGFGNMELVHSTARNELQDFYWERFISPTGTSSSESY